jgi:hypothetical protein
MAEVDFTATSTGTDNAAAHMTMTFALRGTSTGTDNAVSACRVSFFHLLSEQPNPPEATFSVAASGSGYALDVLPQRNYVPGQSDANGGWLVTEQIPGVALQLQGSGSYNMNGRHPGVRGTLDLAFTLGTAGTAQAVAFMESLDSPPNSPAVIGIAVDTSNRPYAYLADLMGNIVAQTTPSGSALPAGQLTLVRLAWDSQNVISGGLLVSLRVNHVLVGAGSWTGGATPWYSFYPVMLEMGVADSALSVGDFKGSLLKLTLSRNVVL